RNPGAPVGDGEPFEEQRPRLRRYGSGRPGSRPAADRGDPGPEADRERSERAPPPVGAGAPAARADDGPTARDHTPDRPAAGPRRGTRAGPPGARAAAAGAANGPGACPRRPPVAFRRGCLPEHAERRTQPQPRREPARSELPGPGDAQPAE